MKPPAPCHGGKTTLAGRIAHHVAAGSAARMETVNNRGGDLAGMWRR